MPQGGVNWTTVLLLATVLAVGWAVWSAFRASAEMEAPAASNAAAAADALQKEILEKNIDRAGDPVLGAMYQDINIRHFQASLPPMAVMWEPELSRVGEVAGDVFRLEGMFGNIGKRTAILLNPTLQSDPAALTRALCHEMVHAHLHFAGDASASHGPAFQNVLRRLSEEGAFEGIVATEEEQRQLRTWLDAEAARLKTEQASLDALGLEIAAAKAEVERAVAALDSRIAAANAAGQGWPSPDEVAAATTQRDAYNARAAEANARGARLRADQQHYNSEVTRYKLMVAYPGGQ